MIPRRPYPPRIREIQRIEGFPEFQQGSRRIEQFNLCLGGHRGEITGSRIHILIVPEDKLLQRRRRQKSFGTAIPESLPSDRNRGVDMQEDEKWSAGEGFDNAFVVDGGRDEVVAPVGCGVVEEGGDVKEFDGLVAFFVGDCHGDVGVRGGFFDVGSGRLPGEGEDLEGVVLDEVVEDRVFAGADAWILLVTVWFERGLCLPPQTPISMVVVDV